MHQQPSSSVESTTYALASKVPQVTLLFWVMKICATTLGETAGDLLSMTLNIGYALSTILLLGLFLVTLACQMGSKRYHPFLYWMVILATSTAGTTMSDYMDRSLGLGYATGSAVLIVMLIAILAIWRQVTGSLAVDHIRSFRVEMFYWTAILISNTLGTALGDYLADDSGLGFAGGAALIASAIAFIALLKYLTPLSTTLLFWCAFVLTRPLGATAGDLLTKDPAQGGLGLGTIGSSLVLGFILIALILHSLRQHKRNLAQATESALQLPVLNDPVDSANLNR